MNVRKAIGWGIALTVLGAAGAWLRTKRATSYTRLHPELRSPLLRVRQPAFTPTLVKLIRSLAVDFPTPADVHVELRRVLWRYLAEINRDGKTILLTSHYLEEVERLCRQIAIVNKGRVVREGTKDEMVAEPGGLEQAYLVATGAEADHVAAQ